MRPTQFDAAPGGGGGSGSRSRHDEQNRPARVAAALPGRFIATVRALQLRFAIDWPRTALFGFSQGDHGAGNRAGRARAGRPRDRLQRPLRHAARVRDTCLHLLHGDEVLPHGRVAAARCPLGADVTPMLPQIGHELDLRLIERAIDQLRRRRAWRGDGGRAGAIDRGLEQGDSAALRQRLSDAASAGSAGRAAGSSGRPRCGRAAARRSRPPAGATGGSWPASQPMRRSWSNCDSVSMPSAITDLPSEAERDDGAYHSRLLGGAHAAHEGRRSSGCRWAARRVGERE